VSRLCGLFSKNATQSFKPALFRCQTGFLQRWQPDKADDIGFVSTGPTRPFHYCNCKRSYALKISNTTSTASAGCSLAGRIKGQGLTEYAIILALVAIAAIGATSFFGDTVKASFVALGSELTGGTRYDMVAKTSASLKKADGTVSGETTLGNYRD